MGENVTAEKIIDLLKLEPHPEGGFYRETWRSDINVPVVDGGHDTGLIRSAGTAIYYLLTPDSFSAIHRLQTDEIFHHYCGGTVEILQLRPDGGGEIISIGSDLASGERPQCMVPAGVWQGCHLAGDDGYSLLGTTLAPGFEFDDFELGRRDELISAYSDFHVLIRRLTRE